MRPRFRPIVAAIVAAVTFSACATSPVTGGDATPFTPAETTAPDTTLPTVATPTTAPARETAVAVTTTTTAPTTTTTTLPPGPFLLTVVTDPAVPVTVLAADGSSRTADPPFSEDLPGGPVTVTADADGYNALVESIDLRTDLATTLYLDPAGQLVHKLVEFTTAGAPKQVAFTPDMTELWVTLLDGGGVDVHDPRTGDLIRSIELPEAGSVEVIFNRAGTLAYVSQMETASVYEVDVATHTVLRNLPTEGVWTKVMALSPDEGTLYASNWVSNDVSEIDLASGEVLRRIRTVTTPRGLAVTPDGARLYVAGYEDGEVQVFDLATGEGEVLYRSGGAMRHLVLDPAGDVLYASDMARAEVLVVDDTERTVVHLGDVDRVPNTIDVSPDGRVLFVSCRGRNNPVTYYQPGPEWGSVVLIDTTTGLPLDAIVGGNQPTGLDVSPDGSLLAYSDFLDDRVTIYSIPPYEVLAAGGGGRWEAHKAELAK
jgi:YVTN family beta-propeller protein